ncbi:ABC transporter permease [Pendulispora albinea]|uniref:ABC transporter permease n=1 Tax=Pendulispora albinea TaxID=2741071 RepID=A0ABZ2M484_9BACT
MNAANAIAPRKPTSSSSSSSEQARLRRIQDFALALVLVLLVVAGGVLRGERFLNYENLKATVTQASAVGILAIGMTFIIATGGIDLSVGSVLAFAAIAGGKLAGSGDLAFLGAALLAGTAAGAINGIAVAYGKVVPFIATLAMLTVARGTALWMSDKTPISVSDLETIRWFGAGQVLGVPVPAWVLLSVAAIGWVLLNQTRYGRYVVAVGSNREAARIGGVRVQRVLLGVYAMTGLCAGLSAILLTGRLASASPIAGNFYELDAIAAVVIGGTSLAGGKATVFGTLLGVLTFAVIFNLLTLLDMRIEIQQIVKGIIIFAAVLVQRKGA